MKQYLEAVRRTYWLLLLTSAAIAAAALPLGRNGQLTGVLKELSSFEAAFDRKKLEAFLLDNASRQGQVTLDAVARLIATGEGPAVSAGRDPPVVSPLVSVELGTLGAVNAFSGANASVAVSSPDPRQLAAFLRWRLVRRGGAGEYRLLGIKLRPVHAGRAEIELERRVVKLQEDVSQAQKSLDVARQEYEQADAFFVKLRKMRAHWKPMLAAQEQRDRAGEEMARKQRAWDEALAAYRAAADKAERFDGSGGGRQEPETGAFALADAALKPTDRAKELRIRFPVALETRRVSVPHLTGCEFAATKAANLWNDAKDNTAAGAIRMVRSRFSWHFKHLEVLGFRIGGMTFLQLSPLVLLLVLVVFFLRIRKAETGYNPFDTASDWESLPAIGLKFAALDLVVTTVLPVSACVLCAWSLSEIDEFAVLPMFCGSLICALGILCQLRMNALGNLRDAVTRSHRSIPPKKTL